MSPTDGSRVGCGDLGFRAAGRCGDHNERIWIRLPNTRRRELLSRFETALQDILSALERGETLIEVV
jgi:hypothetical protein